MVFGPEGRLLTVMELLSGASMVSLMEDRVKFSEGGDFSRVGDSGG